MKDKDKHKGRTARLLLGIYIAVCFAALVWPGYELLGNRVEPFVLGLPFAFAWHIAWVVMTCLVIALFHVASGGDEDI